MTHAEVGRLLVRRRLPTGFERWNVTLAPGERRTTTAAEWAGALVLVQRGSLEVGCIAGGTATFKAGDMLCLGWLPLRWLRNPGDQPARLVAIRRAA
jgi:hypothetical protein